MSKRAIEMAFYDDYIDDEFLMIVVHVTEHLTGNQFYLTTLGYTYLWHFVLIRVSFQYICFTRKDV